jgi:anti-sigma factor RsiW
VKCEECTPLLEDYLYHKPGATRDERLAEHLSVCSKCAGEYAQLRKEQELYARCDLQLAPEFWAGVRARIRKENNSRFARFPGLFNVFRFDQVAAFVTCLLIVAGLIGLWRYFEMRQDHAAAPATVQTSNALSLAGNGKTQEAAVDDVKKNARNRPTHLSRSLVTKIKKPARVANAVAERNPISLDQKTAPRDLDLDSARHLEQVQMLLRSFENGRSLAHANTLDLTYEIRLSKNLLARNALLRDDAELSGNIPLTRLLDRFEPFLLDIANLRHNSDQREIRLVSESLTKAQIVAALQAF